MQQNAAIPPPIFNLGTGSLHAVHGPELGRAYAVAAAACLALMTVCAKLVSPGLSLLVYSSVQGSVGSAMLFAAACLDDRFAIHHPDKPFALKLFFRGLFGSSFFLPYLYSLRVLPPQKVAVLTNTYAVWMVLLTPLFLGDRPSKTLLAMVGLSLFGIAVMIDPTSVLPAALAPQHQTDSSYSAFDLAVPLVNAFAAACVGIFLRVYAGLISPAQNIGYYFVFGCFINGLASCLIGLDPAERSLSFQDLAIIITTAALLVGNQGLVALAISLERPSIVSLIMNLQVVLAYALDLAILGSRLDWLNVLGGSMILVATSTIAFSKDRAAQAPAAPQELEAEPQHVKPEKNQRVNY